MQTASLTLGILALMGMIFGFFPCIGWFNWLNIPFAVVGLIVSIVAQADDMTANKNNSLMGIIFCTIAIIFGSIRLIIGAGFF